MSKSTDVRVYFLCIKCGYMLMECNTLTKNDYIKSLKVALAVVALCIGHRPENRGVIGLVSSQGTCLGCGSDPQLGVSKRHLTDVSLTH